MDVPHRELATADAANLVLPNLQRVLADTSYPKKDIGDAAVPIYRIRCDAQVVRMVTSDRLSEIPRPLRNSKLCHTNYRMIRRLWEASHVNEPNFPRLFGEMAESHREIQSR